MINKKSSLFQHMLDNAPPLPGPGIFMKVASPVFSDENYEATLLVITEEGKIFSLDCSDGDMYEVEGILDRSAEEVARHDAAEFRPLDIEAFRRAWGTPEPRATNAASPEKKD